MFITEQKLFELKFSKSSKYYNQQLVDIFFSELGSVDLSILEYAKCFYHRLVDVENNIWEIRFSDGSFCLLKISKNGEYAKCFPKDDFTNINSYFI